MILKKDTARNRVFNFPGISITVLTVTISKDGAAFGAPAGTLSNITGNYYKLALTSADTDTLGDLAYKFSDSILGAVTPQGEDVDQVGPPDVTLADNVSHGGPLGSSGATLALGAVNVSSTGSTPGVAITSVTGNAIDVNTTDGVGLSVQSSNSIGVQLYGAASGFYIIGGLYGMRIEANNDAGGAALRIKQTSGLAGDAVVIDATGGTEGFGLKVLGKGTKPAVQFGDGTAGAEGLKVLAGAGNTNAPGVSMTGMGTGQGLKALGGASGSGILAAAGASGNGGLECSCAGGFAAIYAHGSSGAGGIIAWSTDAAGVDCQGNPAFSAAATSGNNSGMVVLGTGTSPSLKIGGANDGGRGVEIIGHNTFAGLYIEGGNGVGPVHAVHVVAQTGDGLHIETSTGDAIALVPQDGNGISIAPTIFGNLTATGISVLGAGTGPAVQLGNGSTGAEAFKLLAGTANTDADAVSATGAGTGVGFRSNPAAVGFGGTSAWDDLRADHITPGSFGEYANARLTTPGLADFFLVNTSKVYTDAVAGSVIKEIVINTVSGADSAATIANALWTDIIDTADFTTEGSIGKLFRDGLMTFGDGNGLTTADNLELYRLNYHKG